MAKMKSWARFTLPPETPKKLGKMYENISFLAVLDSDP